MPASIRMHWMKSGGEYTRSTTDFYNALENEGFTRQKLRNGSFVTGLALGTKADVTDDFLDLHINRKCDTR